jgi:hypothetical protein
MCITSLLSFINFDNTAIRLITSDANLFDSNETLPINKTLNGMNGNRNRT